MERKTFINRILTVAWVSLLLIVLGLFLQDRLSRLPAIFRKLRREPQALVKGFAAKDMSGFRCDFSRDEDREIWVAHAAGFSVAPFPLDPSRRWARVTYTPGGAPGFLWTDETIGLMDWRRAGSLVFGVYNPNSWAVDLKIKVKDSGGQAFQKSEKIGPGEVKTVSLPVSALVERLDAGNVSYFNLFLWDPATESTLYFGDFAFLGPGEAKPAGGHIRFLGLEFPRTVRAGEEVSAAFYFIPRLALDRDHLLLLRFRRGDEVFPLAEIAPPFPTTRWPPGKMAKVGPVPIAIPPGLAAGAYGLEAILARPLEGEGEPRFYYQPYENPELAGFRVGEITVAQ